jgi:hypothetical protein
VEGAVWDIEAGISQFPVRWRTGRRPALTVLLGHTLGNLECAATAAALEPLKAAGIELDDFDFTVRYLPGVVTGEVVFRRSVTVGDTTVPAGHALRCFYSRRFTADDVFSLFDQTGWSIDNATLDNVGGHMVLSRFPGPWPARADRSIEPDHLDWESPWLGPSG